MDTNEDSFAQDSPIHPLGKCGGLVFINVHEWFDRRDATKLAALFDALPN